MKKLLSVLLALSLILSLAAGAAVAETTYVYINGATVHVRDGAGTEYWSLGIAHKGEALVYKNSIVTDDRGVDWYKVSFKGTTGYVSSRYASFDKNGVKYVYVKGNTVNVRESNNLKAKIIAIVHKNERLTYTATAKDSRGVVWYKVFVGSKPGWISSRYASTSSSWDETSYVKASNGQTWVRKNPSLSGTKLTVLEEGDYAEYLGEKSRDSRGVLWYKVKFDGKTGWVSSRYTKIV